MASRASGSAGPEVNLTNANTKTIITMMLAVGIPMMHEAIVLVLVFELASGWASVPQRGWPRRSRQGVARLYVCNIYIYIYIYIYMHTYIYIYIHTHTHIIYTYNTTQIHTYV